VIPNTITNLPVGPEVESGTARRPERVALKGRLVEVQPLNVSRHAEALFCGIQGRENYDLWAYLGSGPFEKYDDFERYLTVLSQSSDPFAFAIVDKRSEQAVGIATYLRIEPSHRVIEVGHLLFAPILQNTTGATEAMYLMARHAFEELGYRRYEWKCNALNAGSRRAALRLGFQFEGVFRQHMIIKGRNRDTAWFSMLDSEWPRHKEAFDRWLQPANFDEAGKQKISLATIREGLA
jgi:RimJ/RimL family protein N-acetyltransferase